MKKNSKQINRWIRRASAVICISISGCATTAPHNINDACEIFTEKSDWYDASNDSFKRWGVPVQLQLAIIYQESKFLYDAKPPKKKLFGLIPWGRKSSAYGYAQAQDSTWQWYQDKTGNHGASRENFSDAVDFIGWYCHTTNKMTGISKWDAYNQYLAYHEGQGGYKRKTYNKKSWLLNVARRVDAKSQVYRRQLGQCKDRLQSGLGFW